MEVSEVFNMSLEFGKLLTSMTTSFTGSWFLTFIVVLLVLLLIASMFKMPEILSLIPLIPIVLTFAIVDPQFRIFMGIISIFLGYALYQIIPSK